jgi:hypothetical protein
MDKVPKPSDSYCYAYIIWCVSYFTLVAPFHPIHLVSININYKLGE